MADIVWGSPASLFCLGFFLGGLGVFIISLEQLKSNKQIPW
ncbi:hypothetical protein [Neobacillus niacini]|nr:hypothetical protein [Neobacillus niacini]